MSKINGETPVIETQHLFLNLPALAEALKARARRARGQWHLAPNVIRFSQNILDDIKPRAMTRDIDRGIRSRSTAGTTTAKRLTSGSTPWSATCASVESARRTATPSGGG